MYSVDVRYDAITGKNIKLPLSIIKYAICKKKVNRDRKFWLYKIKELILLAPFVFHSAARGDTYFHLKFSPINIC